MRRRLSIIACFIAITATAALAPAAANADGFGPRDNLVSLNNSDSSAPMVQASTVGRLAEGNDPVTDTNLAYARSFNCTGCRTVAVAIDVVVVAGSPKNVQPQNVALAVNQNCYSCATFAYANQYLLWTHQNVNIDNGTWYQLARIRSRIDQVARSGEDFPTMNSQLDQLSQQLYDTVAQALANQNSGPDQVEQRRQTREQH